MNLNINDFSGPFDVLLHMIKKHQMDIYEVDIKIIIDEYIDFIGTLDPNDLDQKSEYLIMASELIHLKSKLLLGFDDDEEETVYEINSEDDLKNRIIEFAKYQSISEDFRKLEENRQSYFTKVPENLKNYVKESTLVNDDLEVDDLLNAMLEIQKRMAMKKPIQTKIAKKEKSVKDKTNYIRSLLEKNKKIEFTELFEDYTREDLVVTFLSILEMSKNKEVSLSQSQNFSKIFIEVI